MSSAIDYVRYSCGIAGEEVANYVDELEKRTSADTSLIEQLQARVAELEVAHAAAVLSNVQLREVLIDNFYFLERHSNRWDGVNGKHPNDIAESTRAILATPISTEALDAYVAEKVKENSKAIDEFYLKAVGFGEMVDKLTRQRDLAVEALKIVSLADDDRDFLRGEEMDIVYFAIKESEESDECRQNPYYSGPRQCSKGTPGCTKQHQTKESEGK